MTDQTIAVELVQAKVVSVLERDLEGTPDTPQTPLESLVGLKNAEEVYEQLSFQEQLLIDLLAAGWSQVWIGRYVFGINQSSVSSRLRRIRFKLANTKLKLVLEARLLAQSHPKTGKVPQALNEDS